MGLGGRCLSLLLLLSISPLGVADKQEIVTTASLFEMSLQELMQVEVVVATGTLEPENQVFGSVYKIFPEDWQASGSRMVFEPLSKVPGVDSHLSIGGSRTFSIRGYTGGASSSRGKALLFDGIPLNGFAFATSIYSKSTLPLNTFNSLELVKGPFSSFYGPDAFHGALLMRPWLPEKDELKGSLEFGYLQDQEIGARGSYQITEGVRGVTNVTFFQQDDAALAAHNLSQPLRNGYETKTLNQSLITDIGQFSLLYHKAESEEFYDIFSAAGPSEIDFTRTQLFYYKHQIELTEGMSFKPYIWYHDSEFDFVWNNLSNHQAWHDAQYGAKAVLDWQLGSHLFTFGAEYIDSKVKDFRSHAVGETAGPNATEQARKEVAALFVHYQHLVIEDKLVLDMGLRTDHFSNSDVTEVSPKLGLIWFIHPDHTLKLLYGEGYRAPAAAELTETAAFLGNPELNGESLTSYELIYLYQTDSLKWNTSVYQSRWKDAITTVPTEASDNAGLRGEYFNIGSNRAYGIESELSYYLSELNLLSYVSGHYARSENDASGQEFSLFPRLKLLAGLRYDNQRWRASLEHLSKFNRTETGATSSPKVKDYHSLDFSLSYLLGQTIARLHIDNLLNRNNIEASIWNVPGGIAQQGREFKLSFEFQLN